MSKIILGEEAQMNHQREKESTSRVCRMAVADLLCGRFVSVNTAQMQGRLSYEAGKCHLRHMLVISI